MIWKDKSISEILKDYEFPHRFYVSFAVACAKDVVDNIKDKKTKDIAMKALSLAERFSQGEDIPSEELRAAANAANAADAAANAAYVAAYAAANAAYAAANAVNAAARAAYAAAYAANAAANAAYAAAYAAANAAHAAHVAANTKAMEKYKNLLIDTVETQLSKVELILLGLYQ